jgi:hypothetical protein
MPKADFAATRAQAEADGLLSSGGFFKFKEGDNRLRLMSICLPHTSVFDGRKNFKWLCYILDRRDGEVKAFFMPHKVYKAIEALQLDPEYAFEEVPMPYDINIKAKWAGTKEVEYTLLPARRATDVTPEEMEKLEAAKPLQELKDAINEKQNKGHNSASSAKPESETPPQHQPVGQALVDDDIPFAWMLPLALPLTGAIALLSSWT